MFVFFCPLFLHGLIELSSSSNHQKKSFSNHQVFLIRIITILFILFVNIPIKSKDGNLTDLIWLNQSRLRRHDNESVLLILSRSRLGKSGLDTL